jgi:hypothetical protein
VIVIYYSLQNSIPIAAKIIYKLLLKFCIVCCFLKIRVNREYPNPNPNLTYRVPEITGNVFSGLISGSNFHYPNFELPELSDPKKSGNPNAHA